MKNLSALLFVGLVAFSGCGKDDSSNAPAKPQSLYEAQASLPDNGYWMCRLDFQYPEYNGYYRSKNFLWAGESRAAVKAQISETCLKGGFADDCAPAIQRREFKCVRAQNTGGLNDYPSYTVCNLAFQYPEYNGYYRTKAFRASGVNQGEAMKKIIDTCVGGGFADDCSKALLAGVAACSTVD